MDKQGFKNILVVDDDISVLEIIKDFLGNSYQIYTASMGFEALRILHDYSIDLLTIDLMMPEMTGIDLLKEIRKFNEKIPYIFISGYLPPELMDHELVHNAAGYLPKPFPFQDLRVLVDKVIK